MSQKPNISFCFSTHFTKLKDHSVLRHKDHQPRLSKATYYSKCLILTWAFSALKQDEHPSRDTNMLNTPYQSLCIYRTAFWKLHYCILVPAATKVLVLSLESQLENCAKDQGHHRLLLLVTAREVRQLHNLPAPVSWKAQCPKYLLNSAVISPGLK